MNIEEVRKAAELVERHKTRHAHQPFDVLVAAMRTLSDWAIMELSIRDAEAAGRALPLLGNVVPGFFDESDTWRVEHVITGVGKTAILLTDRRDSEQVMLECIKTQGQLLDLLAALKGGES